MATKTTIEMAREAAGDDWGLFQEYMPEIHKLVELVRADERARMAEQPAQKCSYPYCGCNSKAWCKVERNEALDKMAENARELGLDYEPVCNKDPQGCWNVRCQLGKKCKNTPAQRTWVGLTDEERDEICLGDESIARSIEAKLREKNGGNHGS